MPVMTTGGIRQRAVAKQVLTQGIAVVGMATALAITPDLPRRWFSGEDAVATPQEVQWKDKVKASLARMSLVKRISLHTSLMLELAHIPDASSEVHHPLHA
jgi:2,4-dienoyl-CoA reductase-like NADH-dependent reductase (Old Yellow Enzyme family)